jgi:hypothetical protein
MFIKAHAFRIVASVALVGSGMMGVSVLGFSGSANAVGAAVTPALCPGHPTPFLKASPDVLPNSQASEVTGTATTVRWKNLRAGIGSCQTPAQGGYEGASAAPGDAIVITECQQNAATDATACNENPANLDQPGGPYLYGHRLNAAGNGHMTVQMVDAPNVVGDNSDPCTAGSVCFIAVAEVNISTQVEQWSELIGIAFNPYT